MIADAVLCLALNVHWEAGGEPMVGQLSVAHVTIRRAELNRTAVCWEVFRDQQFSWANSRNNLRTLPTGPRWKKAQTTAALALAGFPDPTPGATHYHTTSVHPHWARKMRKIGVRGNHVFYREAT